MSIAQYKQKDYIVETLGECKINSPLNLKASKSGRSAGFTPDDIRIYSEIESDRTTSCPTIEKAGPREKIYFRPAYTKAALVTCGGLCPGLNHVIRSLFMQLYYRYGVKNIVGIPYGYAGLNPKNKLTPIQLTPELVTNIHRTAGTYLGSSRGNTDPVIMADTLESEGINILFTIGGDGTLKAAHEIYQEVKKRGLDLAIVGVPKTIDNDINYVYKTFGFDTAVEEVRKVLECAHAEAKSHQNGIGLVKVMGRDAGFIAAHAAIASREVNFCLIPEIPFEMIGPNGLLRRLQDRLERRDHAVIIVSEGAGQELILGERKDKDASGNLRYKDIGIFLRDGIHEYFREQGFEINLKYITPSYQIRSVLPTAHDSVFCDNLSRYAVHAAMAGKTDVVIGLWHNVFTHIPIGIATAQRKRISPSSKLWFGVLEATGQAESMLNDKDFIIDHTEEIMSGMDQ
ncbi:MAG: ATP-dependent 6-phosphofructokinase [Deferribacteres bacterium]|nr:ATP-dependent 6-phosphofructokinase [candidate division KSB1 bacterium]MCB9502149.1 ATP-dependent 6-phosphofructokinase [Deferribacteres bacterium]